MGRCRILYGASVHGVSMPRVIAGTAGGRRLKAPQGQGTRPTSDRVKEALWSALGDVVGMRVLDLYAGSGGLGIEALSRGAAHAVFVESDRRVVAVLRENLRIADVVAAATVVTTAVGAFCAAPIGGPFDVVLLDAPYRTTGLTIESDLAALIGAGAIADGARVVLERSRHVDEAPPAFLVHDRDRLYGDTLLRWCTYRRDVPSPLEEPTTP